VSLGLEGGYAAVGTRTHFGRQCELLPSARSCVTTGALGDDKAARRTDGPLGSQTPSIPDGCGRVKPGRGIFLLWCGARPARNGI